MCAGMTASSVNNRPPRALLGGSVRRAASASAAAPCHHHHPSLGDEAGVWSLSPQDGTTRKAPDAEPGRWMGHGSTVTVTLGSPQPIGDAREEAAANIRGAHAGLSAGCHDCGSATHVSPCLDIQVVPAEDTAIGPCLVYMPEPTAPGEPARPPQEEDSEAAPDDGGDASWSPRQQVRERILASGVLPAAVAALLKTQQET